MQLVLPVHPAKATKSTLNATCIAYLAVLLHAIANSTSQNTTTFSINYRQHLHSL